MQGTSSPKTIDQLLSLSFTIITQQNKWTKCILTLANKSETIVVNQNKILIMIQKEIKNKIETHWKIKIMSYMIKKNE